MAKAQDLVSLDSIVKAIQDKFGEKLGPRAANLNSEAARAAFQAARTGRCKSDRIIMQKVQWLPDWDQMPIGVSLPSMQSNGVVLGPGSAWQSPEGTIKRQDDDHMKIDYRWCKGCGICAQICPVNAIDMIRGVKVW
jgi:ferredoxin